MSDTVIRVENLSKKYILGSIGTGTLSRDLNLWWYKMRGLPNPYAKVDENGQFADKSEHWALKDVSFDIKQGDAVGIIGKNGAGKSTLLKILSRITTPTSGTVKVKGRIASLLEVGTGFNGELSGRENIYLNGAILGMNKAYINSKLDEIIAFSGVEKYIDTPVKRYSSGMYVRLAFAVAAHLEPEILIVDEVLAVGDAEFQKKCLGKMNDVSQKEGRTVLFVSHNMGAISQLCTKSILLRNGNIIKSGKTVDVINFYVQNANHNNGFVAKNVVQDIGISEAFTLNEKLEQISTFTHDTKIHIVTKLVLKNWVPASEFRIVLRDNNGKALFTSDLVLEKSMIINNELNVNAEIPANYLRPGSFSVTLATFVPHQFIIDIQEDILPINVIDGGSKYASSEGLDYGYVFFEPKWTIN